MINIDQLLFCSDFIVGNRCKIFALNVSYVLLDGNARAFLCLALRVLILLRQQWSGPAQLVLTTGFLW